MLISNGAYVGYEVITSICHLISSHSDLWSYFSQSLLNAIKLSNQPQSLIQVIAWALGEYQETEQELFDKFIEIFKRPSSTLETKCYLLTAIAKIAFRSNQIEKASTFLSVLAQHLNVEIQQRVGELLRVLSDPSFRSLALIPMETPGEESSQINSSVTESISLIDLLETSPNSQSPLVTESPLVLQPSSIAQPQTKPALPTPPPESIEALKTTSYIVYFQIQQNQNNPNVYAIKSTIFSLEKIQLTKFLILYAVPSGWQIAVKPPSSNALEPLGGPPIEQLLLLQRQSPAPLLMKTQTTYLYRSQPIKEFGQINPNIA